MSNEAHWAGRAMEAESALDNKNLKELLAGYNRRQKELSTATPIMLQTYSPLL
jgi:hypothetical protein